jgi:hypothetical protein
MYTLPRNEGHARISTAARMKEPMVVYVYMPCFNPHPTPSGSAAAERSRMWIETYPDFQKKEAGLYIFS